MINPDLQIKRLFQLYKKEKDHMSKDEKQRIRDLISEYKQMKGWKKMKVFESDK